MLSDGSRKREVAACPCVHNMTLDTTGQRLSRDPDLDFPDRECEFVGYPGSHCAFTLIAGHCGPLQCLPCARSSLGRTPSGVPHVPRLWGMI